MKLGIFIGLISDIVSISGFALTSFLIVKNRDNVFISMRSVNILLFTNICLFFCQIIISLIFYKEPFHAHNFFFANSEENYSIIEYLGCFFFPIHIMTYISILCKNLRILRCTKIQFFDDDLTTFKNFKTTPSFFETFYLKIILILVGSFSSLLIILLLWKSKMIELFSIFSSNKENFWVVFLVVSVIESLILISPLPFLTTKELKVKIKTETYSLIALHMAFQFVFILVRIIFESSVKFYFAVAMYLFLVLSQGVIVVFPYILCKFDDITTILSFSRDLVKDFYLFLANEQCYSEFEKYLLQQQESKELNQLCLNFYTSVMKFRITFLVDRENSYLDARKIYSDFYNTKSAIFSGNSLHSDAITLFQKEKKVSLNMFDEGLDEAYKYLKEKYLKFQETEEFEDLVIEINYNSYLRCKLDDCNLIS